MNIHLCCYPLADRLLVAFHEPMTARQVNTAIRTIDRHTIYTVNQVIRFVNQLRAKEVHNRRH